jgi:DNA-binding CsgD family transcriptional regulator
MGSGPASISFSEVARNEPSLNRRQRDVLGLIAAGKTNGEIAAALGITLDGAKWNVSEILSKLGVASREEAAAYWRWRQRRLGPRVGSVLRALVGIPGLKWVAGSATVVAVGAVALWLFIGGGTPPSPAAIRPFYLEAHITVADPEYPREAYLRWSYQDDAHFRTEYELVQPWLQTGTSVTVGNGTEALGYDMVANAYSAEPLEPILPWERLREFGGVPLIGPAPADTMAGVIAVFSCWGLDGPTMFGTPAPTPVPVPARVVGHDRILGRDVDIIEYIQGRIWVDPQTMTILKNASEKVAIEGKIVDRWVVEVTRLDENPKFPGDRFVYGPPAGSLPASQVYPTVAPGTPSGQCTPTPGGGAFCIGGQPVPRPIPSSSGLFELRYLPVGYSGAFAGGSTAGIGTELLWTDALSYAPGAMEKIQRTPGTPALGGDYVRLEQRRHLSEVPALLRSPATLQVRGQTAYLTQQAGLAAIAWAEGDLVVRLSSNAVGLDELLKVAAGLEAIP